MKFSTKIRLRLKELGIKQKDFCKEIGKTPVSFSGKLKYDRFSEWEISIIKDKLKIE